MYVGPKSDELATMLHWSVMVLLNPLRAKFFRVNINMSLHFMSFLHIDMILKILPQLR